MGSELGVTSNFLYPIVVAVSVITTFTTPFCMGFAEPAYTLVQKLLPQKLLNKLPQEDQPPAKQDEGLWQAMLKEVPLVKDTTPQPTLTQYCKKATFG